MYKILKYDDVVANIIKEATETEPELGIPMDEHNRHYQEYLRWVAEGNIAEIENVITEE